MKTRYKLRIAVTNTFNHYYSQAIDLNNPPEGIIVQVLRDGFHYNVTIGEITKLLSGMTLRAVGIQGICISDVVTCDLKIDDLSIIFSAKEIDGNLKFARQTNYYKIKHDSTFKIHSISASNIIAIDIEYNKPDN